MAVAAGGVVGGRRVGVTALLAQGAGEFAFQDARVEPGGGGVGDDGVEQDTALAVGEVGGGGGERGGDGGEGVPVPLRQLRGEPGRYVLAGYPQHGVAAGEPGPRPLLYVLGAQVPDPPLRVADEAVALGAVAPQRELAGLAAGLLGAQDLLLGLQALHGEVGEGGADAVEVGDDLVFGALHVEVGEGRLRRAVVVVAGEAVAVQGEVFDEMGDAGAGEGLVGGTDAEDESGAHGAGGVGEEGRYAVGLGEVHGGRGGVADLGGLGVLGVHLRPLRAVSRCRTYSSAGLPR